MRLTPEQVVELKKQLKQQVQHLPPDRKREAEKQIENMTAEALEMMFKQQQTAQSDVPRRNDIFRMIVEEVIPSKKIDENKEAIAVLDIRPVSKGHAMVIPKKKVIETKFLPGSVFSLAKSVAKRLSFKLKAKSVEIQTELKFGETIVNVIPVYDKPVSINSERYEAKGEELEEVFSKLKKVERDKVEKTVRKSKKAEHQEKILHLKRRIP